VLNLSYKMFFRTIVAQNNFLIKKPDSVHMKAVCKTGNIILKCCSNILQLYPTKEVYVTH